MDWSKAKNIFIIFLIIMNCTLAIVSAYSGDNNTLSADRKQAIEKLLAKNNVEISTDIPTDYSPMPIIALTYKENNIESLKNIFLGDDKEVKRSLDGDSTIFKKNNIILTINNDRVNYSNKDLDGQIENLKQEDAKKIANKFMNDKLTNLYKDYGFHSINLVDNKYYISYYKKYKGYNFFSNYIKFCITSLGIENIELVEYLPTYILDTNRDICSADEALFTFTYEIKNIYYQDKVTIENIELGYILQEMDKKNTEGRAIPCYRISVKGSNQFHYINAYTNEVM